MLASYFDCFPVAWRCRAAVMNAPLIELFFAPVKVHRPLAALARYCLGRKCPTFNVTSLDGVIALVVQFPRAFLRKARG